MKEYLLHDLKQIQRGADRLWRRPAGVSGSVGYGAANCGGDQSR